MTKAHQEPDRIKRLLDKYRSLVFVMAFLLIGFCTTAQVITGVRQKISVKGYDYKELAADSLLRLPKDTLHLLARDSGSLAYKGGFLWVWDGAVWDTASGSGGGLASDTSLLNTLYAPIEDTIIYTDVVTLPGVGTVGNPLAAPDVEVKFSTVSSLRTYAYTLRTGSYVQTNGYTTGFDGGGARYLIVTDTINGLRVDTASYIKLSGNKYAKLLPDNGTILLSWFGAVGDGTTNDYNAITKANRYLAYNPDVKTVLAGRNLHYRMFFRTTSTGFEDACFLRIAYNNVTWDWNGSKVTFDNDETQSYVKYTTGGVTGIYRCKRSHVSATAPSKVLYWQNYEWQLIQDSVSSGVAYPAWATATQYYGANDFIHLGNVWSNYPDEPAGNTENIVFKNLEITAGETDSVCAISGYWNVNSKFVLSYEKISGFTLDNIYFHNILSEVWFGAGYSPSSSIENMTVVRCRFFNLTEGIATPGELTVTGNFFKNISTHAIESFPFAYGQLYNKNRFENCVNGITSGGAGSEVVVIGDVKMHDNLFKTSSIAAINLTGLSRGADIYHNTFIDNTYGIYAFGNNGNGYIDLTSDLRIQSNNFMAEVSTNGVGIALGASHADAVLRTANISISQNLFGATETAVVEATGAKLAACVSIYGDRYRDIFIKDNIKNSTDAETSWILQTGDNGTFYPTLSGNTINKIWTTDSADVTGNISIGGGTFATGEYFSSKVMAMGVTSGAPRLSLYNLGSAGSTRMYDMIAEGDGKLRIRTLDDLGANPASAFEVARGGGASYTYFPQQATFTNGLKAVNLATGGVTKMATVSSDGTFGTADIGGGGDFMTKTTVDTATATKNLSGATTPLKIITTGTSGLPIVLDHAGGSSTNDNFIDFQDYTVPRMRIGLNDAKFQFFIPSVGPMLTLNPADGSITTPYLTTGYLYANGSGLLSTTLDVVPASTTQTISGQKTFSLNNIESGQAGTGTRVATVMSTGEHSNISNSNNGKVLTMVAGAPAWGYGAQLASLTGSSTYAIPDSIGSVFWSYAGTVTLTLPNPASYSGRRIEIMNATSGTMTLGGYSVFYVNGAPAATSLATNHGVTIISDGSQWVVITSNFTGAP